MSCGSQIVCTSVKCVVVDVVTLYSLLELNIFRQQGVMYELYRHVHIVVIKLN